MTTRPVHDLGQLAERDSLTRIVLETLDAATGGMDELPVDVMEMLDVLPPEVRREVEGDWDEESRAGVMDEVRSIILEALRTGKTS